MNKKNKISDKEKKEFMQEMIKNKTTAIQHDQATPHSKPPCLKSSMPSQTHHFDSMQHIDWHKGEDKLHFAQRGVQAKLVKQLKQGKIPFSRTLDLHGNTVDEAAERLENTIDHCMNNDTRCLLVIHGKGNQSPGGQAVLKSMVAGWLKKDSRVLAYSSAQPQHGASGALYVLLKRLR